MTTHALAPRIKVFLYLNQHARQLLVVSCLFALLFSLLFLLAHRRGLFIPPVLKFFFLTVCNLHVLTYLICSRMILF